MNKVYFKRVASYTSPTLRDEVFEMLSNAGAVKPGDRVLIKPNLLAPAKPELAMTTHPLIVRHAAEFALDHGARVQVSDSSAMGTFEKVMRTGGYDEALKGLNIVAKPLTESIEVSPGGRFKSIEISRDAVEADLVINLPKLKTHVHMALTLAVKNLFGCIVGTRKPEWHFRVGEDKELFAELIASIYAQIRPGINLMDGVMGMEGLGPGTSGTPRHMGVLISSADALAMDAAICRMLNMPPEKLLTNAAALRLGFPLDFEIIGDAPTFTDINMPETADLMFGPKFMRGFFRRHISTRPSNDASICKYCNECVKICPAKAITNTGKRLVFDYDKCIRCYCCVEVCPHKAMDRRDPALKKALHALIHLATRAKR